MNPLIQKRSRALAGNAARDKSKQLTIGSRARARSNVKVDWHNEPQHISNFIWRVLHATSATEGGQP